MQTESFGLSGRSYVRAEYARIGLQFVNTNVVAIVRDIQRTVGWFREKHAFVRLDLSKLHVLNHFLTDFASSCRICRMFHRFLFSEGSWDSILERLFLFWTLFALQIPTRTHYFGNWMCFLSKVKRWSRCLRSFLFQDRDRLYRVFETPRDFLNTEF